MLDKGKMYIVYCHGGCRSGCATFLLRERGFDVRSMKNGIRDWPFELEVEGI
jgi:rhodanese-related sulfurtransferase